MQAAYERCLDYSAHALGIFLAAFMYPPASSAHNLFFYGFVFIPMLPVAVVESVRLAQRNWLAILCFSCLAYMATTSFWNPEYGPEDILRSYKYVLLNVLFIASVTWLLAHRTQILWQWVRAIPVIFAVAGLIHILSMLGGPDGALTDPAAWAKENYPLSISSTATFAIILAVGQYRSAGRGLRQAYIASVAILALFIVLNQSLFGLLSLAIPGLLLINILQVKIRPLLMASILLIPLLAAGLVFQDLLLNTLTEQGSWVRLSIWQHVWNLSLDSPWFGAGLKTDFDYVYHVAEQKQNLHFNRVHNAYLASFYYGGVIGLLLLTGLTFASLAAAFSRARQTGDYTVFALLALGSAAIGVDWSHIIDHPNLLFLLYWLPVARVISSIDGET